MGRHSLRVRLRSWALWLCRTVVIWIPSAPKMCSRPRSPHTTYLPSGCMNTLPCLALCYAPTGGAWLAVDVLAAGVWWAGAPVYVQTHPARRTGRRGSAIWAAWGSRPGVGGDHPLWLGALKAGPPAACGPWRHYLLAGV